jgi:transitional endoplasmic reticulum ATPase
MTDKNIEGLREALKFSPDNIPLRMLLAENLEKLLCIEEAEQEYHYLIKNFNDIKAKEGLAKLCFSQGKHSQCCVILEDILASGTKKSELYVLYAKALLQEHEIKRAIENYQIALELNPLNRDEYLDNELKSPSTFIEEEFNDQVSDRKFHKFLEKPDIGFKDVGGMSAVKREIDLKIIKPITNPELYKAYGKKMGGGILLYGPPGCGKTFIARATAGEVNAAFISVGLHEILDMWLGNSERNLHDVFEVARNNKPCIIFIDEIDALGASRSEMKGSAGKNVINQFLQELDGIEASNDGVLVIGATNTPWSVDSAFRRPGRFDRILFIPPPDQESREEILKLKLSKKPIGNIDYSLISSKIDQYSGADIDAIIDIAIEQKIELSLTTGVVSTIETIDILKAIREHKPSTFEWFSIAKNYANFANESGIYDDILNYLKKR